LRGGSANRDFDNLKQDTGLQLLQVDQISQWRSGSLFESASLSRLAARFDLRGIREGAQNLTLQANTLDLPPGVQVERSSPESISVVLMHQ
jgi:hypothetical protein